MSNHPMGTPTAPAGAEYLTMLEDALALRQEAVLAVERLLAGPHTRAELAQARRRVEALAAASAALLDHLERTVGLRPHGPPLP